MSHTQSLVPEPTPWGVVSVVGVGLIGGSLAAGLRRRGLAREVVGVGRDGRCRHPFRPAGLLHAG
jgi:prephenate dehydrogenase